MVSPTLSSGWFAILSVKTLCAVQGLHFVPPQPLRKCTTLPLSVTSGRKWSHPSLAASLKTSEEESFLDPESSDDFWLSTICRKDQENIVKHQLFPSSTFAHWNCFAEKESLMFQMKRYFWKNTTFINYIRNISGLV